MFSASPIGSCFGAGSQGSLCDSDGSSCAMGVMSTATEGFMQDLREPSWAAVSSVRPLLARRNLSCFSHTWRQPGWAWRDPAEVTCACR